jgi:hypothetical protein
VLGPRQPGRENRDRQQAHQSASPCNQPTSPLESGFTSP